MPSVSRSRRVPRPASSHTASQTTSHPASRTASLAAALALGLLVWPATAEAQSNPALYHPRYVACHDEHAERARAGRPTTVAAPSPAPATSAPTGDAPALALLPSRPPPRVLPIAPLVVIDVPLASPVPARSAPRVLVAGATAPQGQVATAPVTPAPAAPLALGENDFRCIGLTRGKAGVLRVLDAPPGARFAHHTSAADWRNVNARAAASSGFVEAVPALRRTLERPLPKREAGLALFEALDAKLHAARALGDLGDARSAASLTKHLREREDEAWSLLWLATLPALARLDAVAAQDYAASVVGRIVRGERRPRDPDAARDETLLRALLPLFVTPKAEHLALLARLPASASASSSTWYVECETLAARVRMGDAALTKALRAELSTDLRTQRAVACYSQVMPDVFPGEAPDEVDTLLFRERYESMLHLLSRAKQKKAAGALDATWTSALAKLERGLEQRSARDRAGGPGRPLHDDERALHLVALAYLTPSKPSHAKVKAELEALVRDPANERLAPWLAAEHALALELPGAADLAGRRVALAIELPTRRFSTKLDPTRGFVSVNEQVRVLDALAARGDARFALGLLSRDRSAREAAAGHLARLRPALLAQAACELVGDAAAKAEQEAVDDALLALSALGDTCRGTAHRLWSDAKQPTHVRAMALEWLAMLRDARVDAALGKGPRRGEPHAERRARIIRFARE